MQDIQANIAKNLQRARDARGLSVLEFSEELCISKTSLGQYLRGVANPTVLTLSVLADKLGVTAAELISDLPDSVIQAETILRLARTLSDLDPAQRENIIHHFLALVELFSGNSTEHPEGCPELNK